MSETKKEKNQRSKWGNSWYNSRWGNIRGMFRMMKMMSKGFNDKGGWFGCTPMMAGMMDDKGAQPFDCCAMMGEMMKDENGKPIDWWSMMEKMMRDEN